MDKWNAHVHLLSSYRPHCIKENIVRKLGLIYSFPNSILFEEVIFSNMYLTDTYYNDDDDDDDNNNNNNNFSWLDSPSGPVFLLAEVWRSHSDTPHSVGLLQTCHQPVAETSTRPHRTFKGQRHPCPLQSSKPQFQHANGRTPTL